MGYCMSQISCNGFMIKKANKAKALKAIKNLKGKGTITDSSGRHFSWVRDNEYVSARTLEEALLAWRWEPELDDKGNVFVLNFVGEKLGDDPLLFDALAPYVENGGELEMQGEDGCHWLWRFMGKKCTEVSGRVVYDQ